MDRKRKLAKRGSVLSSAQKQDSSPASSFGGADSLVDHAALERDLKKVLAGHLRGAAKTFTFEREPNLYSGAFPSEIVTCRLSDRRKIQLFLKHNVPDTHTGHGYWGDVAYEAMVYQKILKRMPLALPKFYRLVTSEDAGRECLIIEYVPDSQRLNHCPPRTVILAAQWIGRFHAVASGFTRRPSSSFLNCYGRKYFEGWARRASEFALPLRTRFPWLPDLVRRFVELAPALAKGPSTVVHGEFYPHNIVVKTGVLYPVDWASAAIGRGEIDLASLTEGWGHTGIVKECEEEYCRARWPEGVPKDFREVLPLARIYWPLRWLGESPKDTLSSLGVSYLKYLQKEGKRAGLL